MSNEINLKLFEVIRNNDVDGLIEVLKTSEQNLNQKNEHGKTPLDMAEERKTYFIYKLLTLLGAKHSDGSPIDKEFGDMNPAEINEYLISTIAAYSEYIHMQNVEIFKKMKFDFADESFRNGIDEVYDVARNEKEFHLIHFAAKIGDHKTLQMLLDSSFNPDLTDADGNTPMDYANEGNCQLAIQILAQYDARTSKQLYKDEEEIPDDIVE